MDSRIATYEHIQTVQRIMGGVVRDLLQRQQVHDQSKLASPEVEVFDEYTPKLAKSTYGSDEYKSFLAGMKPALDHHYAANSHHPEHYADGIHGMSLLDLIEMLCDWKAATMRHNDGDIRRSIEINQKRFGYSDEVKAILLNTLPLIEAPPMIFHDAAKAVPPQPTTEYDPRFVEASHLVASGRMTVDEAWRWLKAEEKSGKLEERE